MRPDGRENDQLRHTEIIRDYTVHAEGSVLIETGGTKVICTASVEDKVPPFLKGTGKGWITAEYSMLPRATPERNIREAARGRIGGRTHEIQRLIGRSLRAVVDLEKLGEKTIWLDCDVIQADGGTRTASITGAFVALVDAVAYMAETNQIEEIPIKDFVAATSVGVVNGEPRLDLCFEEDSTADVDMNVVMTGSGRFIEIQATGEEYSFSDEELSEMLRLARAGIAGLIKFQKEVLGPRSEIIHG